MTKEFWINLPVRDIGRSKEFFTKLGFSIKEGPGNSATSFPLLLGAKGFTVMLFEENLFKTFSSNNLADTGKGTEVLLSFDAESREEVDAIAEKAAAAGADVFAGPGDKDGWMYGCGFTDPDGHRWNALYMDMSKMG